MSNMVTVRRQYGTGIEVPLIAAFAKRLASLVEASAVVARWGDEEFAILLPGTRANCETAGKRIGEQAGGQYVCGNAGNVVRPMVQVEAHLIDCAPGSSMKALIERIEALAKGKK
jgi:GGDEF domain-containing protein